MTTTRKTPAVGTPTPGPLGSMPIPEAARGILTSPVFYPTPNPWTVPTLLAEIGKGDMLSKKALAVLSRRSERTGTTHQEPSNLIQVWGFQGTRFISLSTGDWCRVSQAGRVSYIEQDALPIPLQQLNDHK